MKLVEITLKQFLEINQHHIEKVQRGISYLFEKTKKIDKVTNDVLSLQDEGYNLKFYYNKVDDKLSYKVVENEQNN